MAASMRNLAIRAAFRLMATAGAGRWLGAGGPRCAVLMMHRVRPARDAAFQPNRHLEITPDFLDRVLGRLRARGIPVVPLEEAAARLAGPRAPERIAVLTFDDGYRDNLEQAAPVLRSHGVPFTVFVSSGMVDGRANAWWMALEEMLAAAEALDARPAGLGILRAGDPVRKRAAFEAVSTALWRLGEAGRDVAIREIARRHGHDIPAMLAREMMDWSEARRLAADPLCRIGGHTTGHAALAMLDEAAARAEIAEDLARIEAETGVRPTTFAYPYGCRRAVGPREPRLLEGLGIGAAVTTAPGLVGPDAADGGRLAWPRVSLNGHFQSLEAVDLLLAGAPFRLAGALGRRRSTGTFRPGPALAAR